MAMTFKKLSTWEWHRSDGTNDATDAQLQVGCLQRIADATELMAKDHQKLIGDRDFYESQSSGRLTKIIKLEHRIAGLRGQITKMRKEQPCQK